MNLEDKLIEACKTGDLERVKFLIENGADIHLYNDYTLIWASERGKLNIVKYLIEQGVDIHAENDLALRWASKYGHLEVVKFLIENGANIHANNDYALRWSARYEYLNVVKYLIENGIDIHVNNDYALRYSVENRNLEIIHYLFSLYEDKEQAFKIILKNLSRDDLSMIKDIIEQYDIEVEDEFLQDIKEKLPSIYDYIKLSKEIKSTKNNMNFDIG